MADNVLFIGWNRPLSGQELKAIELFGKAQEYFARLQSEGKIESFETVILTAHGGDLNGFSLLRGEAQKLFDIQNEEEWLDILTGVNIHVEGVGVVPGYIGGGIPAYMARRVRILGG